MSQPQIVRSRHLDRPAVEPRPGTLLDVATVHEGIEWLDPAGLWDTLNCSEINSEYAIGCDVGGAAATKTSVTPSWVDGYRFAAYRLTKCKLEDLDVLSGLNADAFLANESAFVEAAFSARVMNPSIADLTPTGGAVDVAKGLAALEGHAGAHYAGVPTIHASTQVFSLLDSSGPGISEVGGTFRTRAGSKLVNGGGYYDLLGPAGDSAYADGEAWLLATGEVVLARSTEIRQAELNRTNNEASALAERVYVAGYDCYSAAVRVKVF